MDSFVESMWLGLLITCCLILCVLTIKEPKTVFIGFASFVVFFGVVFIIGRAAIFIRDNWV